MRKVLSLVLAAALVDAPLPSYAQTAPQLAAPLVVTPASADNSNKAATTAYVRAVIPATQVSATSFPNPSTGLNCTWDATHDVMPCLNAAIAATAAAGGGHVILPPAVLGQMSELVLGNGTAAGISTQGPVVVEGTGKPFIRVGLANSLGLTGTQLKWLGAAGATQVAINGPAAGIALRNVAIDSNGLAANSVVMTSASGGNFADLEVANFSGVGLTLTTQHATTLAGQDQSELATEGNTFTDFRALSTIVGSAGLVIDGYPSDGNGNNGYDSTRNHFVNTVLDVPANGSIGMQLAYADQNQFSGFLVIGNGTNDGTTCSIKYVSSPTATGGIFPQNNPITGYVDTGHNLKVCGPPLNSYGSSLLGPGNSIDNATTLDAQMPIRDPESRHITAEYIEPGDFPNGGYRTRAGQMIIDRAWRNGLINSQFDRATRGTTFNNPASGAYTLDNWYVRYDGAMASSFAVSRVGIDQTRGVTPTAARYALRVNYAGPSGSYQTGGTYNEVCQRISDVTRYGGRLATFSVYVQAYNAVPTFYAEVRQNFGSGGQAMTTTFGYVSPPGVTPVVNTLNPSTLGWTRLAWTFSIPATRGAAISTAGDDSTEICIHPVNTSGTNLYVDYALPQFELGPVDTAYEVRPAAIDNYLAARRLQLVGTGAQGIWATSSGSLGVGLRFSVPMDCPSPALSAAPGLSSYGVQIPGLTAYTSSTLTIAPQFESPSGALISVAGFTPTTTPGQPTFFTGDDFLASCEFSES